MGRDANSQNDGKPLKRKSRKKAPTMPAPERLEVSEKAAAEVQDQRRNISVSRELLEELAILTGLPRDTMPMKILEAARAILWVNIHRGGA